MTNDKQNDSTYSIDISKSVRKKRQPRVSDAEIEEALRATNGLQASASRWIAKNMGKKISQQHISARIRASNKLMKVSSEITEDFKDFAEFELFKKIKEGNLTATIFFLKCKAKDRGYIERSEVTGKEGGVIEIASNTVDITKLPEEELRNLEQILSKAEANTASNT